MSKIIEIQDYSWKYINTRIPAIQGINLVRIISLFYIGIYLPDFFNSSHIFIWQSIVILFGVGLWMLWADRFASPPTSESD